MLTYAIAAVVVIVSVAVFYQKSQEEMLQELLARYRHPREPRSSRVMAWCVAAFQYVFPPDPNTVDLKSRLSHQLILCAACGPSEAFNDGSCIGCGEESWVGLGRGQRVVFECDERGKLLNLRLVDAMVEMMP